MCCNVYIDDICMNECPPNQIANKATQFECGKSQSIKISKNVIINNSIDHFTAVYPADFTHGCLWECFKNSSCTYM